MLKLYIHDVEAALKTLHQINRCLRFTRNSHGFGRCSESFPNKEVYQLFSLFPHYTIVIYRVRPVRIRCISRLTVRIVYAFDFRPFAFRPVTVPAVPCCCTTNDHCDECVRYCCRQHSLAAEENDGRKYVTK